MICKKLFFAALSLISLSASAQDKIFKRDGEVIEAKVTKQSYTSITYTKQDNPDGPDYTISKREVSRIVYENGTEERIAPGRKGINSVPADYSHSNIVSFTPMLLSKNGIGFGLTYEHLYGSKGNFAVYVPVDMTFLGYDDSDSDIAGPVGWLSAISRNRSILQVAPGVKYYPWGSRGKIRYATGLQLLYGTGYVVERQYNHRRQDMNGVPVPLHSPYKYLRVIQAGTIINNSVNMSLGTNFYLAADLGLGVRFIDQKESFSTGEMKQKPVNGLAQFSFRLGYRF